jgi:hypothetical protein
LLHCSFFATNEAQAQKGPVKTPKTNPTTSLKSAGTPSQVAVSYIQEGFEDTLFPPPGWTTVVQSGLENWVRDLYPMTGVASTLAEYDEDNIKWLITPQLSVTAGDSLSFWVRRQFTVAYPPDSLYIMVSTTDANVASFTQTLVAYDVANNWIREWVRYAVSLNAYAGQNIYIGFKHYNDDGNGFNMDDVAAGTPVVPVELLSFAANTAGNTVNLTWATATETNNYGFEVERKTGNGEFTKIAFVNGHGTTTSGNSYSFADAGLAVGTYSYRLKQVDFDGKYVYTDAVEVDVTSPADYSLQQNFPNPFNPTTSITFGLKVDSKVTLRLYDALGKEVKTLVSGDLAGGQHKVDVTTENLASGMYIYTLEAIGVDGSKFVSSKKMTLLK